MVYNDFLKLAKSSIQERIYVGEGSLDTYRENVETFKSEHSDIIEKYSLTEPELFVMFMMLINNSDEIQQCASSGNGTPFAKECVRQYDSFLSKVPISDNAIFYGLDPSDRVENYVNISTFNYKRYMIASTRQSIFDNLKNGVKYIINKRRIDKTKAHEVMWWNDANNTKTICFERNTKFEINRLDRINKIIELTEL